MLDAIKQQLLVCFTLWMSAHLWLSVSQHATIYRLPADGSAPDSLSDGQEITFDEPAYSLHSSSQVITVALV